MANFVARRVAITPRVRVKNFEGLYFLAMSSHDFMNDKVFWICPVCQEAKIAWTNVLVAHDEPKVRRLSECPICGCDVFVDEM